MLEKTKQLSGRQKVAAFLMSLGSEYSSEILKYLKEDEIEVITFEIAKLESIDASQKEDVLQEFKELMEARHFIITGGLDYAREILEKSLGSQKTIEILNRLTSNIKTKPFSFMSKIDPTQIINFLQQEHPQTIALVLAYLDPKQASVILKNLPVIIQSDVAKRIATMDHISPEVIREIERTLEKKLASISKEDYTVAGGINSIVDILNTIDRSSEKQIMETMDETDPELAEEIKKRMFVFEDIAKLENKDIQTVIRELDQKDLILALKGVDDSVKDRIFSNMSKRSASLIKEEIEFLGQVRLKDVEEAQQKIVGITRKLESENKLIITRGEEDSYL